MTANLLASTATVGLMLDIETLGTGPDAVVTQTALVGWELADPETILDHPHFHNWPIQPQLELLPARKFEFGSLQFHMQHQTDFTPNDSMDFDDLSALARHFVRAFERMTLGGTAKYELWTRGMFDTFIVKSLFKQLGMEAPWDFRSERDLRTLEAISGVSYKDVRTPEFYVKHHAEWDAKFQILHHTACMKALGAAKL